MEMPESSTTDCVSRATNRAMVFTVLEIDELRPLIAEGQERGFLTVEQIAAALEEVEVTKEQVAELHAYLESRASTSSAPMAAACERVAREPRPRPRRSADGAAQARDRPDRRAEPGLAAALPALDRPRVSC